MSRSIRFLLELAGTFAAFVAGAFAMAWWLTRWNDDRPVVDDEPGGGW